MARTSEDLLYIVVGFVSSLYIMSHFSSLRPAGARSMSMDNKYLEQEVY